MSRQRHQRHRRGERRPPSLMPKAPTGTPLDEASWRVALDVREGLRAIFLAHSGGSLRPGVVERLNDAIAGARPWDKVWIQYDGTSSGVASELVEAGIPRESIVLGFKPASVRPHTGYAVN